MRTLLSCLALTSSLLADVKIDRKADQIEVSIDGAPFTTFYFGSSTRKPFLHPLRAADGAIVTRRGPMETVDGESKDHPHHQGLWIGQKFVNGVNFWETATTGAGVGKIVLDKIVRAEGGAETGVIEAVLNWQDADGKAVVREDRTMTFHSGGNNRIMDFDVSLTAANGPVKFGDTKEGTFAIRLSDKLTEKSKGGTMTNAEGASGMKSVWGKPSPWVDYAGTLDGKPVGVAIFDHPGNPGHPVRWHSRDYGLFAANPFGEKEFTTGKGNTDINQTLDAGKSLRFRYRVVIHPGLTADAGIAELYANYK